MRPTLVMWSAWLTIGYWHMDFPGYLIDVFPPQRKGHHVMLPCKTKSAESTSATAIVCSNQKDFFCKQIHMGSQPQNIYSSVVMLKPATFFCTNGFWPVALVRERLSVIKSKCWLWRFQDFILSFQKGGNKSHNCCSLAGLPWSFSTSYHMLLCWQTKQSWTSHTQNQVLMNNSSSWNKKWGFKKIN